MSKYNKHDHVAAQSAFKENVRKSVNLLKSPKGSSPFFRGKIMEQMVLHDDSQKNNISKVKNKNKKTNIVYGKKQKWILVVSGAVMGLLNGFFGGGGGMVCVPILEKVLKLDSKHAHATAIAVILPLSLISAFIYVLNGYIQSFPLVTVGAGVIAGGVLGSFALKWLPPKVIRIIFAIIMFLGGIKLII